MRTPAQPGADSVVTDVVTHRGPLLSSARAPVTTRMPRPGCLSPLALTSSVWKATL